MIVVESISKYYGARRALTDISFQIESREVVGFLGLNGAGKTTVLKILSGLLQPSAGRFSIAGHDGIDEPREVRRLIGFLPDRPPVYDDMSVRQMVTYAGRLNGLTAAEAEQRLPDVLSRCGLDEVADDLVGWLSHGFRQRVGIAQAIVHNPALVILDEPISGLDPVQIVHMRELIDALKGEHTVLLSSHILGEISQTCDRLLVLDKGHIVAQGSEAELSREMRGGRFQVDARGDAEQTRAASASVDGVDVVHVLPLGGGVSRAVLDATTDEAREEVVASLVKAGLGVRSVTNVQTGLESVFLRLTGQPSAGAPTITTEGGPS